MPESVLAELIDRHPWLPYIAPFALFCALTGIQEWVPGGVVWVYPVKAVLTLGLIVALAPWLKAPGETFAFAAAAVGIAVLAIWVLSDGLYPLLGTSTVFDPFRELHRSQAYVWIGFRLVGAAAIVPVAEEFFWRGFLIRWLVSPNFRAVRMGTFTWYSFLATSALFAVEHDRWLAGLIAGVVYNGLYYRTRSLKACIIAHGTTNLGLGIYVLVSNQWRFW
jgi:CAAX prenyl protease-like protein